MSKRQRTVPRTLSRYMVIGPVASPPYTGGLGEPPELTRPVVEVVARNAHAARIEACKTPEFSDHVVECRGDNRCPYTGLQVEKMWAVLP